MDPLGNRPKRTTGPGEVADPRMAAVPSGAAPVTSDRTRTDQPALVPSLALPKAGGAIQGLGEKFAANPLTDGTPVSGLAANFSPGRAGFGPQLALTYQPGAGNGPFGLEWVLSVPAISRKTEKGLPRYNDASDTFLLSDAEDLVPALQLDTTKLDNTKKWLPDTTTIGRYQVWRYRPRIEGRFARIECLQSSTTGDVFWRAVTKDNVTSIYGQSPDRRIADHAEPSRIFTWLLEASYDDTDNMIRAVCAHSRGSAFWKVPCGTESTRAADQG